MAAIRSFVKIQPITGKSGIAQNMDQVRKSINRMGSVTDGIAKSFYDTTELLKFEKEYLSDTSKEEVTDIKKKDKKEKTKWTDSMRKFRRSFAKKKREKLEDQAEKGVEEGKEEGRKKVEKEKPKLSMLGRFLNGIATLFKYLIIFGALNWLSNPQNAERAVKVFKVLFTIGKFVFKITKMGVGMILDGLTNVFGNYSEEGAIRRGLRGILGVVQLMGGLAVLRTAQYMIMPWKLMKDVNRLRMIFSGNAEASAEAERNAQVRKSGVRDPKTGVIYSKEEVQQMRKAAEKADRKRPGAKKAFEERFGRESRFSKMRRGMGDKYKGFKGKLGNRANKVFGKLGGKVNVGMGFLGGATRIAGGLASGEKASSAIGAGVGQAAGGVLGGIAGTALLGPFLGPFAPIVGNAIGSFLGEFVGKELGPLLEPIFGPIKRYFGMLFDLVKMTLGPIIEQVKEPMGMIFELIGKLGKFLLDSAKILMDFTGFILGPVFDAIGGVVQFVVNNAKRLMNPTSIAGGIADALTFNLFDFDGENKKAAGGPVEMAAGGFLQFGSHPDMLAATGGLYLKAIVGSLGAFGFVGNKVKSVLAPDIQKLGMAFGVSVGTGGGSAAGGVSTSVTFQATQTEKKKVENTKNLTYKKNIFDAIDDGLNKLLISGIKIFDPKAAAQIEKQQSAAKGGRIKKKRKKQGSHSEDRMVGGEKVRGYAKGGKIFLHWTGGGYNFKSKGSYHSIIQGDGSVYKAHPYDQRTGVSHTYLRNSSGIGMSIAAMGGNPDYWSVPVKDIQVEALAKEIANVAKAWGWSPDDINIKNVMTHAEAASGKDGLLPRNDNYGPTMWGGDGTRWDLLRLKKDGKNGEGGNIIRAMARGFMGGDSTVKEIDASAGPTAAGPVVTSDPSSPDAGGSNESQSQQQQPAKSPAKPKKLKTVAEMLTAFKTGLTEALGNLRTNVNTTTTTATQDIGVENVKPERVTPDPTNIMAVGRIRETAMKNLQAIKEKSERDGLAEVYPVVQERVVIQRVTQQINTSGSTRAVYTKPSPLLTQ